MKKLPIRCTSDVHMECVPPDYHERHLQYALPKFRNDKDSVLILAGDIWKFARPESYINFLDYIKDRFKAVVYVNGNHEFYHSCYNGGDSEFIKYIEQIPNFHYLNNKNSVVIDGVVFIGTTLWTDFYKHNPLAMADAANMMYDYPLITWDTKRTITPSDIYDIHQRELAALTKCLEDSVGERRVVVTHHGCSYQSIHPKYKYHDLSNYAFTSDLDELIIKYQPEFWIHGHTHESLNYKIGRTNILVNPVGYKNNWQKGYENQNYNSKLVIRI